MNDMKIHKDPTCGMYVSWDQADSILSLKGVVYYFCSRSCRDQFVLSKDAERKIEARISFI